MIAKRVRDAIERSSWIRKMFEEGARLKAEIGAENVFDFSLGNPNLPPPEKFYEVLAKIAADRTPGIHGYMPNAGFESTRSAGARNNGSIRKSTASGISGQSAAGASFSAGAPVRRSRPGRVMISRSRVGR